MNKLVKQYIQVWNTQKTGELSAFVSRTALYKDSMQNGNAIDILSASIEETARAFPDVSFEIITYINNFTGHFLAFEWSMKGTNTGLFFGADPTNKKIEILGADFLQIEDEKITSIRSYYDSSQFSAQLGLK